MEAKRQYSFENPPLKCHICENPFNGDRIYCTLKDGDSVVALCSTECFAAYQQQKVAVASHFRERSSWNNSSRGFRK